MQSLYTILEDVLCWDDDDLCDVFGPDGMLGWMYQGPCANIGTPAANARTLTADEKVDFYLITKSILIQF